MNSPDRSPTFVIICFRYIGDVLVTTPLAVSIRQAYPDAAIDYMVFEGTEGVLAHNPLIRNVISLPRTGSNMGALLSRFRKYSVALAAYPSDRTVMAALLVGKKSIGLTYAGGKERWKNTLLTAAPICDDRYPVVSNMLGLLSPLGIAPVPRVAAGYDQDDLAYARAVMPAGEYVVMHPYSRSRCKYWPAEKWAELAVLLREQAGCQVVFTRTPDAEDTVYLEQILAQAPPGVTAFRESCSLSRLAAAIKGSRAYIGIDTAVTHIAAAVEVPTIALMGPTLTRYWAPLAQRLHGTLPIQRPERHSAQRLCNRHSKRVGTASPVIARVVPSVSATGWSAWRRLLRWRSCGRCWNMLADMISNSQYNIGHICTRRQCEAGLGDKLAMRWVSSRFERRDYTFADLERSSNRFANVLQGLGLEAGDVLFTFLPKSVEQFFAFLGSLKARCITGTLFSNFGEDALLDRLGDSRARLVVTRKSLYRKIERIRGQLPDLKLVILTDVSEHQSEDLLSWERLMAEASEEFSTPPHPGRDPPPCCITPPAPPESQRESCTAMAVSCNRIAPPVMCWGCCRTTCIGAPPTRAGLRVPATALLAPGAWVPASSILPAVIARSIGLSCCRTKRSRSGTRPPPPCAC